MMNGLDRPRGTTNDLTPSAAPPGGPRPRTGGDAIGFDPTWNQAEQGWQRHVPWGSMLQTTPPHGGIDYWPSFPYRGVRDYAGNQAFGASISELLYARVHGYRGILPINQLPLLTRPQPYLLPAYDIGGQG